MNLSYHFRKLLKVNLFLSLFIVQASLAQGTGTVRGTILDQTTGEGLPSANVLLEGTSIGAAADLDGKFLLRGVPSGMQKFTASYIGYTPQTVTIEVFENRTVEQNFTLTITTVVGEEVIVTAQAQGQLEAINQQLSSDKIVNIVSEARLQELPDFNVAQSIGRLPGVSTLESSGEANKVVIRGLAPKYNQVTIGGISLASTGSTQIGVTSQDLPGSPQTISNDRSVDLTSISPYMIKSVSLYKSLTPDLNANAIGGIVNMELREAPSEFHTDILIQGGYTELSNTYTNYRFVGSASTRFFDDKLGVYFLGNIESYDRNADNMDAQYQITSDEVGSNGYLPVRVSNVQLNRHIETRNRYGLNLILDYRLPSGSIKLVNMFSRLNSDYQEYRTVYDYGGLTQDLIFRYREGSNDVDLALNTLEFDYDLGFMSVDLRIANNYAKNDLPEAPQSEFRQTRGVGISTPNTIPEDLTYLISYGGTGAVYLNTLTLFSSQYEENKQSYLGDFKLPFNMGTEITGYIKFGGQYEHRKHNNAQQTPYATIAGTNTIQQAITDGILSLYPDLIFDPSINRFPSTSFTTADGSIYKDSFLDGRFGNLIWANDPGILTNLIYYLSSTPEFSSENATAVEPGGWFDGYFQTLPNTYQYVEKYSAGYLMSELNYSNLMIVGGVRYEKIDAVYDAYNLKDGRDVKSQQYFPVSAQPNNEFWLPMVQARFRATDWFDVRAAYTQTLARPDYHQLSPHFTISYASNTVRAGNPDLRPAQAFNYDLIFSFHNNELGLFTIGGFYKEIEDFTYSTQYPLYSAGPEGIYTISDFDISGSAPIPGATLFTYINTPYTAYVRGIELDLQTRLWYLPVPFNGLLVGINYAHISSEATYPWRNARTTFIPPRTTITAVFDSTRTGRLINQPNDILNAFIGYDYEGFSARLSFIFQGNAVSNVGNFPEQDGFTRDYFRIDASARQVLPYGIELYLDLGNINSETNTSAQQSIGGFTIEQNYGLTGNLGVRYRL